MKKQLDTTKALQNMQLSRNLLGYQDEGVIVKVTAGYVRQVCFLVYFTSKTIRKGDSNPRVACKRGSAHRHGM